MSAIKDDLTKGWLIEAKRDLLSARQLAQGPAPLLDTAAQEIYDFVADLLPERLNE